MGDVDVTLREAALGHARDLADLYLGERVRADALRWIDTQVAARERRMDRVLQITRAGARRLLHVEWAWAWDHDPPRRVTEYQVLALHADREEQRARKEQGDPALPPLAGIESLVVVLTGDPERPAPEGAFRLSPEGRPFSGVRFAVDALYACTTAELSARPGSLWLGLTPFACDASPETMIATVAAVKARAVTRESMDRTLGVLTMMADAARSDEALTEAIMAALEDEWTGDLRITRRWLQRGKEEGRTEGELAALRDAVLDVLRSRRLRVTPKQRERVVACADPATLRAWHSRAVTAPTTGAIFVP